MADSLLISDNYGRKLYPVPVTRRDSRPQPILQPQTHQNVTPCDRWQLTNQSRALYGSHELISTAIKERAKFSFSNGCFIKSHSQDEDFAAALEAQINETFYANPNVLSDAHDMHSMLQNFSINLERDGGQAAVFDRDTGKILIIPTTLIGNGFGLKAAGEGKISPLGKDDYGHWGLSTGSFTSYGGMSYGSDVIKDSNSPYDGARIVDGFIVDRNRARLAVRVLGFDDEGKPAYKDIPASQIRVDFKTEWSDQIGFIPILATAIMSIVNVQDFDYYIKQAMQLAAQKAVTRTSKDGMAPRASGVGYTYADASGNIVQINPGEAPPATATRVQAYEMNVAGMVELSTENREEIKFVEFQRPSLNEEQFIERVQRGYLHKIWPYDLIFGKNTGRAYQRTLIQQTRMTIWEEQRLGQKFLDWAINMRTGWLMGRNQLPRNEKLFDPYNREIIWPAKITGDEGNDAKVDMDKLGRNLTTHEEICGSDGYTHTKIQKRNELYVAKLLKAADTIAAGYKDKGVTIKDVLMMLDNLGSANPQVNQNNQQPAADNTPPKPGAGNPNNTTE
jgi:hypothetical protein